MQIKWLISQAKDQPDNVVKRLTKYLKYVSITYEQMINEMKMRILYEKKHDEVENAGSASGDLMPNDESEHDSDDLEGRENGDKSPRTEIADKLAKVDLM